MLYGYGSCLCLLSSMGGDKTESKHRFTHEYTRYTSGMFKVKKKNIPELIVKERFSKANLIQFFRRDR